MKFKFIYLKKYFSKYIVISLLSIPFIQPFVYAKSMNNHEKAPLVKVTNVSSNINTEGFVKGTKVLTVNKQTGKQELKRIEKIRLGDTVVTATMPTSGS